MIFAGINLKPTTVLPLYRQLYEAIRDAILLERIRKGTKLPPSRMLAKELGVSRNTVTLAFDQLSSEGYLKGRVGSGIYVADDLPEQVLHMHPLSKLRAQTSSRRHRPSRRGRVFPQIVLLRNRVAEDVRPFQTSVPAIAEFPHGVWGKLSQQVWRSLPARHLTYGDAGGYAALREAIASYLRTSRAVQCEAAQVIIVSGSQQGIDLVGRVLLDEGDHVWVEDPGYVGAQASLRGAGLRLTPVPVDADGLIVEFGKVRDPRARLAYVTPSHQYPLGVTMTLARRMQLLDWAQRSGCWVLEDDYDSEFRYSGRPIASLQGLDRGACVLYLGTFSKVLFPGLRLAYLVVPQNVVDTFLAAKALVDRQSPVVEQAVLARFIEEGHFARHLRRMRVLYEERQQALIDAASKELGGAMRLDSSKSGMHVIGWLPTNANAQKISVRASDAGVVAHPLSEYTLCHHRPPGLLLGYAAFSEKQIRAAVRRLGQVVS